MTARNAALAAALVLSASTLAAQPAKLQPVDISEQVRAQLSSVYEEKTSRSPALKKLSTNLVYEFRELRQDAQMVGVPRLPAVLQMRSGNLVQVDITAEVTPALLKAIRQAGGEVESSFPQYDAIRAWLPVQSLETLADRAEVKRVFEAIPPMVNKINTSEGDVAHRANAARGVYGVNGSGVKVGVLSTAVDSLAAMQGSGDLPGVTVLPGQAGSGDTEGTAMLEIVYDLAPAAQLYFATGFESEASMANNIVQLANLGCDVIVDDIGYLLAPVFQDGIIAQRVDQVAAQGVLYFSAAANSGNLSTASSGTWEGNFSAGGTFDFGSTSGTVHSFGGSLTDQLTATQGNIITLQWSDPWGDSANDYDLCALSADESQVLACSTVEQNGDDAPLELLTNPSAGIKLVVVNFGGLASPRFLHLATNRGRLQFATSGETNGHSAAVGAFSVAAVDVATALGGAFAGGAVNPVTDYSSDGPRRIFFNANGSAITPGNFLATGGTLRQKPDIAAAAGVSTASSVLGGPFNPFDGTSAAAPHAAAIAALMLDASPGATQAQVRQAFASSALDIMAPGIDRDSGYGLIDAVDAIDALTTGGSGCVPSSTTACVLAGRFKIEVQWTDFQAVTRNAFVASAGTSDTALFYWTNPNNWELLIKGVNACSFNNKFWIYFAAATNVGYRVTVTDTQTGAAPKVYTNAVGNLAQATNDINAFNCP